MQHLCAPFGSDSAKSAQKHSSQALIALYYEAAVVGPDLTLPLLNHVLLQAITRCDIRNDLLREHTRRSICLLTYCPI